MKLLPGILVLVVAGALYLIAFRNARRSKYAVALGLILTCGFILRTYLSFDMCLHPWDERYHALVAKNLIRHPLVPTLYDNPMISYDPGNWTENHIWLHKQPLPLWSMALSMSAFGVNEIALRLPSLLLSTLAVGLTFLIGKNLFSKKVGLLAAFLHSIHGLTIELTAGRIATDHIDLFFLVFVELAVYFAVVSRKRKSLSLDILTGAAVGLAILCKWLPALIVVPLWMIIRMKSWDGRIVWRLTLLMLTIVLIFAPWQIYISSRYPVEAGIERLFNYRHITEVLDGHGGAFYYHFDIMRQTYGELIYLPLLWLLFMLARAPRSRRRAFLGVWIFIPFIFFSFAKTKMQAYTIFAAPALFLLTASFFYYVKGTARKWRPMWLPAVCLVLLMALPVRYSLDRLKFFQYQERRPAWAAEIKQLRNKLPEKAVIFNHDRPIEVMFYTDYIAYKRLPSREEISLVKQKGFAVVVVDRHGLAGYWRNDNGIILLK